MSSTQNGLDWREIFAEELPLLDLPVARKRAGATAASYDSYAIHLPAALYERLVMLTNQLNTALPTVLCAAWQTLLYRYTNQSRFFIGSHSLLADQPNSVNSLYVLEAQLPDNGSFATVVAQVQQAATAAIDHGSLVAAKEAGALTLAGDAWQALFAVQFDWMADGTTEPAPPIAQAEQAPQAELRLLAKPDPETIELTFIYQSDRYQVDAISRMAGHFCRLVESLVAAPQQNIATLPLLTDAERTQLLVAWNATAAAYPQDRCLHQLIEEQATRTPDAIAVKFNQRTLTYGELNTQANQVAHALLAVGVAPDALVGICMDRSLEMMVGLLGILKAGGAYVPLDPTYPPERIAFILEDAQIQLLVTDGPNQNRYREQVSHVIVVDQDSALFTQPHRANPDSPVQAQNLAYTIYTSGSTGRPKGVSIPHQAVINFLYTMAQTPGLTADDTLLAVTTISFDIAGLELYLPLIKGATVVLASSQVVADGERLLHLIETAKPTIMQATPATWRLLLVYGWAGTPGLKILCGGEALPGDLAEKLLTRGASVWNLYGPTETTIWSTVYQVVAPPTGDPAEAAAVVPIGRPIANTTIYILDDHHQPVAIGVPGHLFIGGHGLACGYWRRPELTGEKFIPNPFAADTTGADARIYQTGDFARYRSDGTIEFLGRQDHQVKLRGYRIELGEIESVLNRHPAVEQSVVMVKEDDNANKRLIAYIKPNPQSVIPIPEWQLHRLPNRLPFAVINKMEADHLYELIFDHLVYLKHGIRIPQDACVLDIGANIGLSMLFLQQYAPQGRIYLFEPVPDIFDVLQKNIAIYEQIDAVPLMLGLSSKPGAVEFTYYPNWSALSGLYGNVAEEEELSRVFMQNHYGELAQYADEWLAGRFQGKTVHCELRTISQIIREQQIETIDLVKINVEKSEYDILLGIDEADWAKIDQLVIEVHKGEGRMTKIQALLQKHGYAFAVEQNAALQDTVLHMIYAWKADRAAAPVNTVMPITLTKSPLNMEELYGVLNQHLPEYMHPAAFVVLPELPLTPNGKINRNALPDPDANNTWVRSQTAYVPAAEAVEQQIAEIWQEILNLPQVGVLDRFFELGGNSLLAAQVHQQLTQRIPHFTLSLVEMFQHPTIRSLSDYLKQTSEQAGAPVSVDKGQKRAEKRKARAQQRQPQRG